MDTPLNPEAKGSRSMAAYLENMTYEEIQKERDEILAAQPADIRALADQIASILSDDCLCVVGNESAIRSEADRFGSVQGLCE
jgi:Zn-dependent M16 (insulinase) family peptidase